MHEIVTRTSAAPKAPLAFSALDDRIALAVAGVVTAKLQNFAGFANPIKPRDDHSSRYDDTRGGMLVVGGDL